MYLRVWITNAYGRPTPLSVSTATFRRALIVASTISALVAVASCIGLAASFIRPSLDLYELSRISTLIRTAGFCFLGIYIVAGFAFPNEAAAPTNAKASSWPSTILKIICGACFLVVVLSPHTYVYPEPAGWVTKSKAGTFGISSDVAREYLWRAVRMWSAIPLSLALITIDFTRKFVRRFPNRITDEPAASREGVLR